MFLTMFRFYPMSFCFATPKHVFHEHSNNSFGSTFYPEHGAGSLYRDSLRYNQIAPVSARNLSMKIQVAIVGLPNVGKSTLFNVLCRKAIAAAENFPFCTIEPNITPVPVPDPYLNQLATLANSKRVISATLEFVDVAGLVSGASRGEGLGNRFLATVRECDCIIHIIRCFDHADIIHVSGRVAPAEDAEVVNLELILADISHIGRRLEKTSCKGQERTTLEKLLSHLHKGLPGRAVSLSPSERLSIKSMGLLTLKPVIYAFNVDEVEFLVAKDQVIDRATKILNSTQYCDLSRDMYIIVSAKFEAQLSFLPDRDSQLKYLKSIGVDMGQLENEIALDHFLSYTTLPNMIRKLLHLFVVYTGPGVAQERSRTTKAFLFSRNDSPSALHLAGYLHGDIEKGFIRAEVISAPTLLAFNSYNAAKEAGMVRTEGKNYALQDDDVVLIKWK